MPADNLLHRIGAEVAAQRGKPIRTMRTTDRAGRPCSHFDIEIDGYKIRVLNKLSPLWIEATPANLQWFLDTLYAERTAFMSKAQPSPATVGHADSDPIGVDADGDAMVGDDDEPHADDAGPSVSYADRFLADNGPEELPENMYFAPSKQSYIVEVKGITRPDSQLTIKQAFFKGKRHREQFRINRRGLSDYEMYADARVAERKRALMFHASGIVPDA